MMIAMMMMKMIMTIMIIMAMIIMAMIIMAIMYHDGKVYKSDDGFDNDGNHDEDASSTCSCLALCHANW